MYKTPQYNRTSLIVNKSTEGMTMEDRMTRMHENGEEEPQEVQLIYTERKDGVIPGYNIRTDKHEVLLEAADAVSRARAAKRMDRAKVIDLDTKKELDSDKGDAKGESTEGTK